MKLATSKVNNVKDGMNGQHLAKEVEIFEAARETNLKYEPAI